MTMLQPELESFRHELRAAVEADLVRHRDHKRHLRRAVAIGTPAGLAALGLSLALVLGAGSTPSPADAAILASAQGALTPPSNSVFHVAATIAVGSSPAQPYELWSAGSSYRFIKFGYEAAWNGTTMSSYDAASNTLYVGIYSPANHAPVDTAATIRSLISSGQAQPLVRPSSTGSPPMSCHCRVCRRVARSPMAPMTSPRATTTPCSFRRRWRVSRDSAQRPCNSGPTSTCPRESCRSLPARSDVATPRGDRGERRRSPRCWDVVR